MNNNSPQLDNLAEGTIIGLAGRFGGRVLVVLQSLLAARILGPRLFGLYALGWTFFRLAELVAPLGFDIGIQKFAPVGRGLDEQSVIKRLIVWSLILVIVVLGLAAGVIIWISPWIAAGIYAEPGLTDVFRLFVLIVPFSGVLGVLTAATRLTHSMKYSFAAQDFGQPLWSLVTICIFYFVGINLKLFIVADLLSYLLGVILAAYFIWILFPFVFKLGGRVTPPPIEYFRFSWTASLSVFFTTVVFWADRLFVGFYLTPDEMGRYQAAWQVSLVFAVILGALNRILLPLFASLHNEGKTSALEEVFRVGTKWTIYLGLPLALLIFLNPDSILELLYGEPYVVAGTALVVLLIGQVVNLATGAVGPLLLIGGYQRLLVLTSAIVLVINVCLCALLVPDYGIVGAALSNSISVSLVYFTCLLSAKHGMGIWPYDRRYLKGLLAAGAAVVVALPLKNGLHLSPLIELSIQLLVILSVYTATLYLIGLDKEDTMFIGIIGKRMKKMFSPTGREG